MTEKNMMQGEDSSVFRDLIEDAQGLYERSVIIRRWASYIQPSGTTIAQGVTPKKQYQYISVRMEVGVIQPGKDILSPGGTYTFGDVPIVSLYPLFEAQKAFGTEADEIIIDNTDYILVGKIYKVPVAGGRFAFTGIFRQKTTGQS